MMEETVTTASDPKLAEKKRATFLDIKDNNAIAAAAEKDPDKLVVPSYEEQKRKLEEARRKGSGAKFTLLTESQKK